MSGKPENVKCETCVFYVEGFCYLVPPTVVMNIDNAGQYLTSGGKSMRPAVNPQNFCGDWSEVWPEDEDEDEGDQFTIPDALPPFPKIAPTK